MARGRETGVGGEEGKRGGREKGGGGQDNRLFFNYSLRKKNAYLKPISFRVTQSVGREGTRSVGWGVMEEIYERLIFSTEKQVREAHQTQAIQNQTGIHSILQLYSY